MCTNINVVYLYLDSNKKKQVMNPVLKIALEIANGNQIFMNRNEKVTDSFLELTNGNSRLFNSLYFSKNGIEFRVSNHELPNRDFMMTDRTDLPKYYKNNIEVIIANNEIVKTKLNFNA